MTGRFRERIRLSLGRFLEEPIARLLNSMGFTPNSITVVGFCVVVASAVLVALGYLKLGGTVFLVGAVADMFDGALARLSGRVTHFGALLDSLLDRLGEASLFVGLLVYGLRHDPDSRNLLLYVCLIVLALVSSQAVSYLRARGESLGINMSGGLLTRPERVIMLGLGLLFGEVTILVVMGLIVCFSIWTMISRLIHIRRNIQSG